MNLMFRRLSLKAKIDTLAKLEIKRDICDVLSTHNSLGIKLLLRTAMLSTSCFKAVG